MRCPLALLLLIPLTGCQATQYAATECDFSTPPKPFVHVLGIAQDAGVPHMACYRSCCYAAWNNPERSHFVSSISLSVPGERGFDNYLFDATPDITRQLNRMRGTLSPPEGRTDRKPLEGIFLTHAHIGHYTGLAMLGFESIHAQGVPVHATTRMCSFLRENGPWSQLVALGNIELNPLDPEQTRTLPGGVRVTAHKVPHRDEFSDTVAFRIAGPERTLLFMPDTEPWERWSERFEAMLEGVDVLLVDATFFSGDELPGRKVSSIGHPLMISTIERLGGRVEAGRLEVGFIHLNHSNPALDPDSEARRTVESAGFFVCQEGQSFPL